MHNFCDVIKGIEVLIKILIPNTKISSMNSEI